MNQLRTIFITACMLSIAIGICNMLRPARRFERQVRFLVSLLFAIGLGAPLLRMDLRIPPTALASAQVNAQTDRLAQDAQEILLEETKRCTQAAIEKLLAENGISCTQLAVQIHIDDEQCISISEVSAVCSDVQRARTILQTHCGKEVLLNVSQHPAEDTAD
jgi:hypothetical protein